MPNLRLPPIATGSYTKTLVAPPGPTKLPLDRQLTVDEVAQARNAAFELRGFGPNHRGFDIRFSRATSVTMTGKLEPGQALLLMADVKGRWQHLGTVDSSEIASNLKQKYAGDWPVGFPPGVLGDVKTFIRSLGDNSWFDGGEGGTGTIRFPLAGLVVDATGAVVGAHYGHIYGARAPKAESSPEEPTSSGPDMFEGGKVVHLRRIK